MRIVWMMDRDGNDVPFEVVSEEPVECWNKKNGSFGYVAIHVRRASREAVEFPITPGDPRLKFAKDTLDERTEHQQVGSGE